jgi:molybdopterin-containing oxidoreductase family iron-sulfur binding subunit
MEQERRKLLKFAGLTVLGLAGGKVLPRLAAASSTSPDPAPGAKRWAMVIDPMKCLEDKGCRTCVDACHTAHNVPDMADRRHEVKWIWKEEFEHAFPEQEAEHIAEDLTAQSVLVFCNHCDNPPCVRVCPTGATWRRDDGIVMMDWHRCIGCRYCVAGCPYGSRSFNWVDPRPSLKEIRQDFPTRSKGVVEKCTFCEERLDQGRQPACVEACPDKALVFGDLNDPTSEVRARLKERFALRRKPGLGTRPAVYYQV